MAEAIPRGMEGLMLRALRTGVTRPRFPTFQWACRG